MSCFTGDHKVYKKQTVINYNGTAADMKAFMAQKVDFGEPPAGCTGWSTATQVASSGDKLTKTSTITYKMGDGSEQKKVVTETMDL